MTRIPPTKATVLAELRDGGARGCTRSELAARFGSAYGPVLRALERDGHLLDWHESKIAAGEWFRVVLRREAEPEPESIAPDDDEPAQLALETGTGTPPPLSALVHS